jgi:polysaccharide export outer membrane protein
MMNTRTASLFLALLLCAAPLAAQGTLNQQLARLSSLASASNSEYRLGPGDLIEISVFGVDNFKHTLRINASGLIKLPLLDAVVAAGLTPAELESKLTELLNGDVIRDPQVAVFVREYRSQPVFILGAVKSPGQYQISMQLNIIDVLSMAGGVLPNAADEVVIQRRPSSGMAPSEDLAPQPNQILKINLPDLLEKGDLSLNIPVRGGDVINVQERQPKIVYIIGEINRPGPYQLPARQDIRVSQAVAGAGGAMKTAKMNSAIVIRYGEKGERQELAVQLDDILKGKKEDFLIRPDDILFVPGSKAKNIGYGMLGMVPGALANLTYSIPYLLIP